MNAKHKQRRLSPSRKRTRTQNSAVDTDAQPEKRDAPAPRWKRKWRIYLHNISEFLLKDLWHITEVKGGPLRRFYIYSVKSIYMTVKGYIQIDLSGKAAALAYKTVLSIVPMLAVVVGVAKGFGFQNFIYDFLKSYIPSQQSGLTQSFAFVEKYLSHIQGGVFLGIGLIVLFYTVFTLLSQIESSFNEIWEVKRGRSWRRKAVDYLALLLVIPVLMVLSSGLTLMMTTLKSRFFGGYELITPLWELWFNLIPYFVFVIIFTALFMWMPVVKVKFVPALIAGSIAGVSFQLFQVLYMKGVFWISTYNAIYGSFAAVPLLLLWIQFSWMIALFCARLSFSIQNVRTFAYEKESNNISRRYFDFFALVIMTHIVQRFTDPRGKAPHTILSLCESCRLPIALTSRIVEQLRLTGLIIEVNYDPKEQEVYYNPAIDPDKITVGLLLTRLDRYGEERFLDDKRRYPGLWQTLLSSRAAYESTYKGFEQLLTGEYRSDDRLRDLPLADIDR